MLAYFNSVLDWTAYDFHTWLAADPSRFLHGANGQPVVGRRDLLHNTLHIPDFAQPAVRQRWLATVVNTSRSMDGLFIDQGRYCTPFACKARPGFYPPGKLAAWAQGHWGMLLELRDAMRGEGKVLLLNNLNTTDFPPGFDHEYENFNASAALVAALQADAAAGRVATAHSEAPLTTTLPLYLLGAGNHAYFAATHRRGVAGSPGDPGWVEPAWDGWRPEYSRRLGRPMGPAHILSNGLASRRFASGTVVRMNLSSVGDGGCVFWADGNVTGLSQTCSTLRTP